MWGFLIKKVAGTLGGKALGAVVAPFKMYLITAGIAVVVGIVGTHLWNDRSVRAERDTLTGQLASFAISNTQLTTTLNSNKEVLTICVEANAYNADQAALHKEKATEALANVKLLKAMKDRDTEDIIRETDELRNKDNECRTADDPLPDWMLPDSLWDD